MKKALALALALVMALSVSVMAFAEDPTTTKAPTTPTTPTTEAKPVIVNVCPNCQRAFANEAEYNKHIDLCKGSDPYVAPEKDYVDLTVKEILAMIVDVAKSSMSQWDAIESVVIRLVDFLENIGSAVAPADVEGAVADLEAALKGVDGVDGLLDALKAKIKALYAGEVATEPETEVEEPADTGSASVGIAVFAAVSVAAAAAYVCTKKKA
ncbi:MAG: hypothetical protein SPJ42_03570 [Oscillospiraceae bacterium]|nr:hypothetical protein [Oscillospiraceae bacterium]